MSANLGPHNDPTGKTKHWIGGQEASPPAVVRIVEYAQDDGYYLIHYDADDNEITDTFHESIADALAQAEWEFLLKPEDWQ